MTNAISNIIAAERARIEGSSAPAQIKAKAIVALDLIEDSSFSTAYSAMMQSLDGDISVSYALSRIVEAFVLGRDHANVDGARDAKATKILSEINACAA